jgi:enoyl-CoA hydratase/carnithine racemase
MTSFEHPLVKLDIHAGIATIRLDRPEKRNALHRPMMQGIAGALDAVRDDPAVRVVVLRGNGPAFSSGIDHTFLVEIFQSAQTVPFAHIHHDLQEVFHRLERMLKPTIAALHRACVGMAFELALACDFRVATADCVLGLPEILFGIIPDVGGTTRLVRAVGPVKAKELILLGSFLSAEKAERLGLVTEVAGDEGDLDARVLAMAQRLASRSAAAVGMGKRLIQQSAEMDARASFELEGTVQEQLMRQPDLGTRFPAALQEIREALNRVESR